MAQSDAPPARPDAPSRRPGLDAARALAVCAMVLGHTLDAVLDAGLRAHPGVRGYWQLRASTAPLFLLVAGYALAVSAGRRAEEGSDASGLWRRYLPRVALLWGLGLLLRLPLWDLGGLLRGDREVWAHLLGFDALQCIAASLLLAVAVLGSVSGRAARGLWLSALAVAGVALAAPAHRWLSDPAAPLLLRQWLGGGTPSFPLLPWSGFFFLGALLGLWAPQAVGSRRAGAVLLCVGATLAAAAFASGSAQAPSFHGLYFLQRLGMGLCALGLASQLPWAWARGLAPLGRRSLWVYVAHLPVVYGWGYWPGLDKRVGQTLGLLPALTVGLALLAASLLVGRHGPDVWAKVKALAAGERGPFLLRP